MCSWSFDWYKSARPGYACKHSSSTLKKRATAIMAFVFNGIPYTQDDLDAVGGIGMDLPYYEPCKS